MLSPFSDRRFIHNTTVFLPRTLCSVAPRDNCSLLADTDAGFREAGFEQLDAADMSEGGSTYCAEALRAFWHGA